MVTFTENDDRPLDENRLNMFYVCWRRNKGDLYTYGFEVVIVSFVIDGRSNGTSAFFFFFFDVECTLFKRHDDSDNVIIASEKGREVRISPIRVFCALTLLLWSNWKHGLKTSAGGTDEGRCDRIVRDSILFYKRTVVSLCASTTPPPSPPRETVVGLRTRKRIDENKNEQQ